MVQGKLPKRCQQLGNLGVLVRRRDERGGKSDATQLQLIPAQRRVQIQPHDVSKGVLSQRSACQLALFRQYQFLEEAKVNERAQCSLPAEQHSFDHNTVSMSLDSTVICDKLWCQDGFSVWRLHLCSTGQCLLYFSTSNGRPLKVVTRFKLLSLAAYVLEILSSVDFFPIFPLICIWFAPCAQVLKWSFFSTWWCALFKVAVSRARVIQGFFLLL